MFLPVADAALASLYSEVDLVMVSVLPACHPAVGSKLVWINMVGQRFTLMGCYLT